MVQIPQPVQQVTVRLQARSLRVTLQRSHPVGLDLFGAAHGWRRRLGRCSAHQAQALLRRLQHQGYAVFALRANRAFTQAVPDIDTAIRRQAQFDRDFIGIALAALHDAKQQPAFTTLHDVQIQHVLADIQGQPALPGAGICQSDKRPAIEPMAGRASAGLHDCGLRVAGCGLGNEAPTAPHCPASGARAISRTLSSRAASAPRSSIPRLCKTAPSSR